MKFEYVFDIGGEPGFAIIRDRDRGTAAFEIVTAKNKRVLIDPFLDENPVRPIKVASAAAGPSQKNLSKGRIKVILINDDLGF